jgi:hypothetical protein
MTEPRKSVEVESWQASRLKCALGHRYAGRVRRVREEGHDMDGEAFLKPASDEYDPATCVVCGLMTWAKDSETQNA